MTPYRQGVIAAEDFATDFTRDFGEDAVDRERFVKMMRDYAEFANIDLNWDEIERTGTADLVNFCCMVAPYGPAEKQVLLEAQTLEQRAETLIAMTEYEMARGGSGERRAAQLMTSRRRSAPRLRRQDARNAGLPADQDAADAVGRPQRADLGGGAAGLSHRQGRAAAAASTRRAMSSRRPCGSCPSSRTTNTSPRCSGSSRPHRGLQAGGMTS